MSRRKTKPRRRARARARVPVSAYDGVRGSVAPKPSVRLLEIARSAENWAHPYQHADGSMVTDNQHRAAQLSATLRCARSLEALIAQLETRLPTMPDACVRAVAKLISGKLG